MCSTYPAFPYIKFSRSYSQKKNNDVIYHVSEKSLKKKFGLLKKPNRPNNTRVLLKDKENIQ